MKNVEVKPVMSAPPWPTSRYPRYVSILQPRPYQLPAGKLTVSRPSRSVAGVHMASRLAGVHSRPDSTAISHAARSPAVVITPTSAPAECAGPVGSPLRSAPSRNQ
jgi:hypothetical protein